MDGLMADLKSSHFQVGGENGGGGTTNTHYGQGHAVHARTESYIKKGAGQHTNFIIGSDNRAAESETRSRFNSQAPQINLAQREEIKQRMTKDSVGIGGSNNTFSTATTSGKFFYDKD